MTREQIETSLKNAQAKQERDGTYTMPEGANLTFHIAHDGASLACQKLESVRFDGELVHARGGRQTIVFVASDVFAVAAEGSAGQPRRPAGF
jgi:hypothetical protein